MGYELHITRRENWSDAGNDITVDEWLDYIRCDPTFQPHPENGPYFVEWDTLSELKHAWLDWTDGRIYTKNPDQTLIDKMISIARELGANVQGDDGERYDGSSVTTEATKPSLRDHVAGWLARVWPRSSSHPNPEQLPFQVGDRVTDSWGNEHTIIKIDPRAERGLGIIRARRSDGTEHSVSMMAHGFTPAQRGSS